METNFDRNSSSLYYKCIACSSSFHYPKPYNSNDPYQTQLCSICQNKIASINTEDIKEAVDWVDNNRGNMMEMLEWYEQMKQKLS